MSTIREILFQCTAPHHTQFSYSLRGDSGRAYTIRETNSQKIALYILIEDNVISVSKIGPTKFIPHNTTRFKINSKSVEEVKRMVYGFFTER